MGLAYGVVVAGIEAKSHFIDGASSSSADKPSVRSAAVDTHEDVHSHEKDDLVEVTKKSKKQLKPLPGATEPAKKQPVKKKLAAKQVEDAAPATPPVHPKKLKAKGNKHEKKKSTMPTQDPAKPLLRKKLPKALELEEQKYIKKVEQKALAEVKHEVKAAAAAKKQKHESSLEDMLNVPEEDFEQTTLTEPASSSGTVDDILKMEKELLEDEVLHPSDGTTGTDALVPGN